MTREKGKNRALLVIAGLLAVLALAILALVLFVDIGKYRPGLETEASRILGLDVKIRGEMKIEYFPPFGVSLGDIHGARRGATVFRVERMRAGLKILCCGAGSASGRWNFSGRSFPSCVQEAVRSTSSVILPGRFE